MKKFSDILGLLVSLGLSYGVAAIGAVASINAAAFYSQLLKPFWAPPGWVFGPVWSVLYFLMAVSAWLVWRVRAEKPYLTRVALNWYVLQLVANALWSWLFFAWHLGLSAFLQVLVLLILIYLTIEAFRKCSRAAAVLMVPYLLWVCFASVLTLSVWLSNPELLS